MRARPEQRLRRQQSPGRRPAEKERKCILWNTILFDLDGTLTDSANGIAVSVQSALRAVGIDEPDVSKLRCFAGPPLHAYFMEYAGLDADTALAAVDAYRKDYAARGMFINSVYPLIGDLLYNLKKNGMKLAVVTSKETSQATRILKEFGLLRYFDAVAGCTPEDTNTAKEFLIEHALRALGKQYDRAGVVMVGDRFYDVEGAKAAGVASIGVSYGYGSREELEQCGADYIVGDQAELGRLLLSTGRAPFFSGFPTTARKVWNILWPVFLWFVVSNIVGTIFGAIFGGIYAGLHADQLGNPEDLMEEILNNAGMISQIASAIADVIMLPILWKILAKDELYRSTKKITLRTAPKPGAVNALFAVFMGFGLSTIINLLVSISGLSDWMYEMNPDRFDAISSLPIWADVLILCIIAPVFEELLFRGVMFRRLRDYVSFLPAALCSAAIFGLVHFDIVTGISAFVIGVIMAWLYEYTGSIFSSMLFHFGFNFYSVFIQLMNLESMEEGAQGTAAVIILIIGIVLTAVSSFILWKRLNKRKGFGDDNGFRY